MLTDNKENSAFSQAIKDKIKDSKINPRTITPQLKDFIDMLITEKSKVKKQSHIKVDPEFESESFQRDMANALGVPYHPNNSNQESGDKYEHFIFFFFISKDNTEKKSIFISTKNKYFYSTIQALTELDEINTFVSIATYYPKFNEKFNKCTIRRVASQTANTNVLIADLDTYKTDRFKDKSPKEVYEYLLKEKADIFDKLPIVVVSSGNGLQLYCHIDMVVLPSKEQKTLWKAVNQKFNDLFLEYGSDPHCSSDIARIFRLPDTYNCKKEKKLVKLLNPVPKQSLSLNQVISILGISRNDLNLDSVKVKQEKKRNMRIRRSENKKKYLLERIEQENQRKLAKLKISEEELKETMSEEEYKEHLSRVQRGILGRKNLYQKQYNDLMLYLKNRDYNIKGFRHSFFFCLAVCNKDRFHKYENTFECVKTVNQLLIEPFSELELERLCLNIYKEDYSYLTNNYIQTILEISDEETETMLLCYNEEQRLEKERKRWEKRKDIANAKRRNKISSKKQARITRDEFLKRLILDNWDLSIPNLIKTYSLTYKPNILYKIKSSLNKNKVF